jgi:outer membrane autotransporter protein
MSYQSIQFRLCRGWLQTGYWRRCSNSTDGGVSGDLSCEDNYTETGAGDLNLIVDSCATGSYQSYLGMHIGKAITMGYFVLAPDARVKWAHEFSSDDHLINVRFSSSGSQSFTVVSARPNRYTVIAGVGMTGGLKKNQSIYIQYDAELNSDYINHTGTIGLRFSW